MTYTPLQHQLAKCGLYAVADDVRVISEFGAGMPVTGVAPAWEDVP